MSQAFAVTLSLDDYIAANFLYHRKYWLWRGLVRLFAMTAVGWFAVMLVWMFVVGELDRDMLMRLLQWSLWVGVGMTLFLPVFSYVLLRIRAPKFYRKLGYHNPSDIELDDAGVRASTAEGIATWPWANLHDFVQDGRVLLIRRARMVFVIVPKAQLDRETLEAVIAMLRAHGVKEG